MRASAHSHPPSTACRRDYPTASIHPWLWVHTSFLLLLPSFLPPSLPLSLPACLPAPDPLLRLLQCLPELWETYPLGHAWGHTRPIRLKKTHPNPSRQAACSHTGSPLCAMQCFLCVSVWARCVGLPRFSWEQILPFTAALNPMASCSLRRFPTLPRCGAPPLSSQDYISLVSTSMRNESFYRLQRQIFLF